MRKTIMIATVCLPALGFAPAMFAQEGNAPTPSLVQRSWQLDFRYQPPKSIRVRDVDGSYQWYWYMTYTIINRSGDERTFIPNMTITTNQGDIITAGRNVPVQVFNAIKEREGLRLLESPNDVIGRILIGEDHARESVIIWPTFKDDVDQVSVMVTGLSGETQIARNPLTDEPVVLRKTIKIDYRFPGTFGRHEWKEVVFVDESWVMR